MPGRRGVRLSAAVATLVAVFSALAALPLPAHADADDVPRDPLGMTITSLTPASLPAQGPITIRGTITNHAKTTWNDLTVYPFVGTDPITTSADLAAQAAEPMNSYVGERIYAVADRIGTLQPGQTRHYRLTIPRKDVDITQNGVYWFGARAYGATGSGSDDNVADGRARTFLPYVKRGKHAAPVPVSLLLPIRARVIRTASGRIADEAGWTSNLTHGHLASILAFGTTHAQVTWLIDPAVLDAVRQLAAGNQPRDLSADQTTTPSSSPSSSPTASSSASPPVPTATPSASPNDPFLASAMKAAQTWLHKLLAAVAGHQVLALPYGDPDLAATAAHDPSLVAQARTASTNVMSQLGIDSEPAAAPPNGYVDAAGLSLVHGEITILSSNAVHTPGGAGPVVSLGGEDVYLTSAGADAGGPSPSRPYSGVALRQRILAEAALSPHRPLFVSLPWNWQAPTVPGGRNAFFRAFKQTWLELQPLTGAVSTITRPPTEVPTSHLVYPRTQAKAQVRAGVFPVVNRMLQLGNALDDVLPDATGVADQVLRDALTSTSYEAHVGQGNAALASGRSLSETLAQVQLSPPPAVTLSGASGRFSVSVTNRLSERVRVDIRPSSDSGIQIHVPEPVTIAPGSTTSVLMTADTSSNGVHHVLLHLTSSTGVPLGSTVEMQIRSAQVSKVIWAFIGAGIGVLGIAIAIRLTRRVRRSAGSEV